MIPFNRPTIAPFQTGYVDEVFQSGHLSGDGSFTKQATNLLESIHHGSKVLLTTSCTAALEMTALLLDLELGDEVIVPSFTFVSSANAFALMGAHIVFADIDQTSLCIDIESVERLISKRTKAVVVVNYGGVPAIDDRLIEICSRRSVLIIEDNAHGLFGSSEGKALGTRSGLSTLSFHETKNVTSGEGGALVINDVDRFADMAEVIREKGTNRSRFFRGMVDKYTWESKGSSYLLSDINAAVLFAQLQHREEIQTRRRKAFFAYQEGLGEWASRNGFTMPHRELGEHGPFHLFPMLAPSLEARDDILRFVRGAGVACTFHYLPLHVSPAGQRFGSCPLGAPHSVSISDRLVRLPLFSDITENEIDRVIEVVGSYTC